MTTSEQVSPAPAAEPRIRVSRGVMRRLARNGGAVTAAGVFAVVIIVAVASIWWTPADPYKQNLAATLVAPGVDGFPLGSDQLGRDVLSRLLVGARVSLLATGQALVVALGIGVPLGFIAGMVGGWIDSVIMRVTDALISFPSILLAIGLIGALGPGLTNAMLALGVIAAPAFIRLVRNVVRDVNEATFVEAAQSTGASRFRIAWRHILPNILSPITVMVAVVAASLMLAEASLSFLGLGVQPPIPSWGSMVNDGFSNVGISPTLGVFPGLMLTITVLCLVVLGDALRDAFGREERRG